MTDEIIMILFFVFAIAFIIKIISLPTAVAYFVNLWLKKKGVKYIGPILLIAVPTWTVYEVYTAIYPTDSFYESEFEYVTTREIPNSATIISKTASYPDFNGDYCSASMINISSSDYKKLLKELKNDSKLSISSMNGSAELSEVMGEKNSEEIIQSFQRNITGEEDRFLTIGFLKDGKTIVVQVCFI